MMSLCFLKTRFSGLKISIEIGFIQAFIETLLTVGTPPGPVLRSAGHLYTAKVLTYGNNSPFMMNCGSIHIVLGESLGFTLPNTQFALEPPGCAAGSFGFVTNDCIPPVRTILSSLSIEYKLQPICNCLRLFRQPMPCPFCLALPRTGKSSAARIAIMVITTSSSISVNASASKLRRVRLIFSCNKFSAVNQSLSSISSRIPLTHSGWAVLYGRIFRAKVLSCIRAGTARLLALNGLTKRLPLHSVPIVLSWAAHQLTSC